MKKKMLTEKEYPELYEFTKMSHEEDITLEQAIGECVAAAEWAINEVYQISDYLKHLKNHGIVDDYLVDGSISSLPLVEICEAALRQNSFMLYFMKDQGFDVEFNKFKNIKMKAANKETIH